MISSQPLPVINASKSTCDMEISLFQILEQGRWINPFTKLVVLSKMSAVHEGNSNSSSTNLWDTAIFRSHNLRYVYFYPVITECWLVVSLTNRYIICEQNGLSYQHTNVVADSYHLLLCLPRHPTNQRSLFAMIDNLVIVHPLRLLNTKY